MVIMPDHQLLHSSEAIDFARLMSQVGEAIVYCDANWVAQFCNDVYLTNLGMARSEVIGRTPFDYVPSFKRSIFHEPIENCRVTRRPMCRIGFSTVLNRWLMVRVFPVGDGMLMLANDASESVVKQYQLAQKAVQDPLTGLGNKLAMGQRVEQLLERSEQFTLVILGLDRLKDVNDAHGYAAGDMVLLEVASCLQSATMAGETLYRINGNEFAVLQEHEPIDDAAEVFSRRATELIEAVKKPITLAGLSIVLGASAGTVESPRDGGEPELLLRRAGLALREAKKDGRDAVAAYRPELELASQVRAALERELRGALDGNQFVLMIQPKVALCGGNVVGGEALIRWAHPKRGMLGPAAFLGIAHDIGVMVSIDQWVLRQALRACAVLAAKGCLVPISINLSVDSLADIYLADRVREALNEAKVAPEMLEVEIPEGALMRDVQASAKVLKELSDMGVRISIDDFGTGYSSFAYLAQFPVHALKVDRSFINDITTSDTSNRIVKGMVRLAHSLSLEVVAEGAENEEQIMQLRRMKCDTVQGYVIAKPMPLPEFKAFLGINGDKCRPDPTSI